MKMLNNRYRQFQNYQLIKLAHAIQYNLPCNERERLEHLPNELELLQAEIKSRGIKLTKVLVKRWSVRGENRPRMCEYICSLCIKTQILMDSFV